MEEELKKKNSEEIEEGTPFYPNHFLKEVIVAFLLFGVLLTLAVLFSFGLEEKANPFQTPEGIKPEWYFLAGYQLLKYVPKILGILGIGIALIILLLIPFIEKRPDREPSKRRLAWSIGIIVIIFAFIFSFLGYISESTRTILGKKVHFDLKGVPHSAEPAKKESPSPKPEEQKNK
jgi:quinol-cytochrome oxidoreductase complex cytochrome b subunit